MANLSGVSAFSLVYTRRKIFIYLRSKQNKTRARGIICIQTLSLLLIFCTRIENLIKAMAWPIIQFLTDRISQWELQAASVTRPNNREWKQIRLVEHGTAHAGEWKDAKCELIRSVSSCFVFSSNLNKYLITFWAQTNNCLRNGNESDFVCTQRKKKPEPTGTDLAKKSFSFGKRIKFYYIPR